MRILLTGATGLLGHHLVYRLIQEGHDLVLLGRNARKVRERFLIPCEVYSWNAEKSDIPGDALRGVQAVIHLAGEPIAEKRWSEDQKRRIRNSRVNSTRHLVDSMIQHQDTSPQVFICASAVGFYGDRGDEILDESSTAGKGFLAEVCQGWEREAARACEIAPKTRCVQLRFGMILSRDGGALSKLTPIFEAGLGGPIGSGKQWMSWIHIDDVVEIIVNAISNTKLEGPINAVAPNPITHRTFSASLAKTLHRPMLLPTPKSVVKLAFGEMSQALLFSQRVMPTKLLAADYHFLYPTLTDALNELFPDWHRHAVREFITHQWIPKPVEEVFPFFSEAENLESITPPWLGFHVLKKSTPHVQAGTLIDYRLKLHGLPIRWQSRVEEWIPNRKFVDVQTRGPYSQWRHEHFFASVKGGTLLTDRVLYKLPLGTLGAWTAGNFVKNDVAQIFDYRRHKIEELFTKPGSPTSLKRSG